MTTYIEEFYGELDAAALTDPTLTVTGVSWLTGDTIVVFVTGRDETLAVTGIDDVGPDAFEEINEVLETQNIIYGAAFGIQATTADASSVTLSIRTTVASHTGGIQRVGHRHPRRGRDQHRRRGGQRTPGRSTPTRRRSTSGSVTTTRSPCSRSSSASASSRSTPDRP